MYGRQFWLLIDKKFRITMKSVAALTYSTYIQKLRDHIKWTHEKADHFQQKEAQCHKWNYDQCDKVVSLKLGVTFSVCVTAFKGWHKIQSRWENTEYVVEWQPYPNLLVYVVDGQGCIHTLHRNFLLLINSNLENKECVSSVGGERPIDGLAPVPHRGDTLPVDHLTRNQPKSMHDLPSELDELVVLEMTRLTSMDPFIRALDNDNTDCEIPPQSKDLTDKGLLGDSYMPVSLRNSSRLTRNQLLKRYQNFALQQSNILSTAFDICIGLCVCFI